ncbi:MAG TPA: hypothetical protein VN034_03460 [Sphingopyxis sp.]|nr:hypothetical protein [Sphingopyxis sp.]
MSGINHHRKGPPRPGSSSMDHPRGLQRAWIAPQEKAKKAAERENDERIRKAHFRLLNKAVRLEPLGVELEQRRARGEHLSFFDKALLEKWRTIKGVFEGTFPTCD